LPVILAAVLLTSLFSPPKDWKATQHALGRFDLDSNSNDEEGARW